MIILKRIMLICCVPFIVMLSCSGPTNDDSNIVDNTNFEAQEVISYGFVVTTQSYLSVNTGNGNIEIVGVADTDSVLITAEKIVKSESVEDAEAHLDDLSISIDGQANDIYVLATPPIQSEGRYYGVKFTMYVPEYLEISAVNVNKDIRVEDIKNTVSVSNTNGGIDLDRISGSVYVTLVNGTVASRVYLPADGKINMDVTDGSAILYLPTTTSAELTAYTTNGVINVNQLDFTEIIIDSEISFMGNLGNARGTIYLEVLNGNITIFGF